MQVILLERIGRLGQMGDVVKVKDGYGRNFLLPQGKALRANAANKVRFEAQRAELEARHDARKSSAEEIAAGWKKDMRIDAAAIRSMAVSGHLPV